MPRMFVQTIAARVAPSRREGQSVFEGCFEALFPELRDAWFVVDGWRPDDFPPRQRELLGRYRVAAVDVGRRVIDVYRGKRFLPTFGFAVPARFGGVFAFPAMPDTAMLRAATEDYDVSPRKVAAATVASFVSFEGTWTFATPDARLVEVLRAGLPPGVELIDPPRSLNFAEGP